ncbi:hypothetical protein [Glutamicibacter sp. HZAU]|uniref:hypothetical protein n=1 Tax=Glutamicibacter sp. HZAU TaxID=2049891 RepID=UPI000FFB22B4|nr:hypothetical protein [Glutamicibacter sp. HZAU]RWZ79490.1 hypothetical protein EKH49_16315 [Glutamicibacter sp. HZAU]
MELARDARVNGFLIIGKIILVFMIIISTFNVSTFLKSADRAINRSFSDASSVNLYSLTDTYSDPESFYEFRQSIDGVSSLGEFYNLLNVDEGVTFLSVFDQSISVADFKGGEHFDAYYRSDSEARGKYIDEETGQTVQDIKSMQMNENAFMFYNLNLTQGAVDWSEISYENKSVPVILGNDYSGIYYVGDTLKANFYFEGIDLVVSGFLEPDSSLFYKGEMNTFLDDQVIVPYPSKLNEVQSDDLYFSGILYFAMFAGDIAVPKDMSTEEVLQRLNSYSSKTGFTEYALMNVPSYLVQHQFMKQLIQDNAALLAWLGILLFVGVSGISFLLSRQVLVNRVSKYSVRWVLGDALSSILRTNGKYVFVEYLILVVLFSSIVWHLPNFDGYSYLLVMALLGVIFTVDLLSQRGYLARSLTKTRKAD